MGRLTKTLIKDLKARKEGLIVGGIIGFLLAQFVLTKDASVVQAGMESQGVLTQFIPGNTPIEVGKNVVVLTITTTFALLGYIIDGILSQKR